MHSYTFIDRNVPLIAQTTAVRVVPYRVPAIIEAITERSYLVGRALDWGWSAIAMTVCGLAAMRARRHDVVFVPASELPHMALAAFLVGKLSRAKIVFCNLNTRAVPGWALTRLLHRHVDHIITLSRALAAEIRAERIDVPLSINGVGVDGATVPAAREDLVVYIARHTPAKGVWDVVDIWERVHARRPGAKLAMAGVVTPSVRRQLEARLAERGLRDSVSVLGPVDESVKWDLYARARCCLFPSRVEGWGIVPIESMMSGAPVVAYDLPAFADTILGKRGVTLVPIGDSDAAAAAVLRDLARSGAEETTLEDALRAETAEFGWEAVVAREEAIIGDVARG